MKKEYAVALEKAAEYHGDQTMLDGEPYIVHLITVAHKVKQLYMRCYREHPPAELMQTALLHDILEDTDYRYDSLCKDFGKEVADNVHALTKLEDEPKELRMRNSLERIALQKYAPMVKMADRIINLSCAPLQWSEKKIMRYRDEALEIHRALGHFNEVFASALMESIERYTDTIRTSLAGR
jgi:guanosine-3',5'-bis(diphosphate) 3'-pyrophosphohydrolase